MERFCYLPVFFFSTKTCNSATKSECRLIDNGNFGKEFAHHFSAAKSFSSDIAMKTSVDSIQILGGAGYMKDHPLERFMRDAKQLQIIEGTTQIQQILIAKILLGY